MTALPRSAEAASCSGRADLVRRWAGHRTRITFPAIPRVCEIPGGTPGRLDIPDRGHFTWEDDAEDDTALITTWWGGRYATI
jgi:hypothetical protein